MSSRSLRPLLLVAGAVTLALTAGAAVLLTRPAPPAPVTSNPKDDSITCLGRISPADDIIRLSGRSISGQPSLLSELFVKAGDDVKQGQVLAVLNSREQLEASWRAAVARTAVAERRLAQVKAGVKEADLSAQRATIARLESELSNAKTELGRYESLQKAEAVAPSELDAKKLAVEQKSQALVEAKERLTSLAQVRPEDVALAEAEVASATMSARLARIEFDQSEIRSPIDGRVVEIHTWPGEELRSEGILELVKTDAMYVVAEVADRDIARIRVGQRASATSSALEAPLEGAVERIGLKVAKNDVLNVDPTAMSDARVVETWIRLDDPGKAAGLIHAEVTVRITP
jgi:HlyD family secretion protein